MDFPSFLFHQKATRKAGGNGTVEKGHSLASKIDVLNFEVWRFGKVQKKDTLVEMVGHKELSQKVFKSHWTKENHSVM